MDLALEIGMTEAGLTGAMTERELSGWMLYCAKGNMLPSRRIQLGLANVCVLIAQTMGGRTDAKLSDYLFDPKPKGDDNEGDELTVDDVAAMFGGTIIRDKAD